MYVILYILQTIVLKTSIFASKSEKIQKKHHFSLVKKSYITFHPHSKRQNTLKENSNPQCPKSTYERIPFINGWLICNKHNKIKNLSKYSSPIWFRKRYFTSPLQKKHRPSSKKHRAKRHRAPSERPSGTSMDVNLARCIKAAVDCPGHPLVKVAGAYAGGGSCHSFLGG